MTKGQKTFIVGAILVATTALLYLSFGGIGENLVYYWTPTEMADHGDEAVGAQIRLGGVVEAGSLKWDKESNDLTFRVSDGDHAVAVEGRSVPPQMFREDVGVVVEGTLRTDGVFVSDRLLVKHDNQYQAPEDGSAPDMDALRQSMTPDS